MSKDNSLILYSEIKIKDTPLKNAESLTEQLVEQVENTEDAYSDMDRKQKKTFFNTRKNTKGAKKDTAALSDQVKDLVKAYASYAALKKGVQVYAAFSDNMLRVKALTGATKEEYKSMTKEAKRLGATTSFTASQVGEAYTELAQKGYKVNEIMGVTPGILSLAEASQMGLGETAKILTGVMNAYRAEADQAQKFTDILAKAQGSASVTTESLGEAYKYTAGTANRLGYSVEQVTSWIMALGDSQLEGSMAGTALNATFTEIINKTKQLKKLDVEVYDNGKLRSLTDIMEDLKKSTANMTEEQRNLALSQIFGETSIKAVSAMMGKGIEKSREYEKGLENSAGTARAFSEIMNSEVGGSLRSAGSAIEGAAINIITTLTPAIMAFTDILTAGISVVNWFFEIINQNDILQSIAAGLAGAGVAVTSLTWLFNLLNISNPFGWIALGITGITILEKKFKVFTKTAKWVKKLLGMDGASDVSAASAATNETKIPKNATGTNFSPGGMTLVGEQGPELVNLPRSSKVSTALETKKVFNQNKTTSVTKQPSITVQGDNITISLGAIQENFEDVKYKLEKFLDARERRKSQRIKSMLGGV